MDPMTFMTFTSLLMGGFQALTGADAAGQAKKLAQQQQQQQADLERQQAQEKSNLQIQEGQNAETAKALATKNQMGPTNAGFGGMLFQPANKALLAGVGKGGGKLFGM